MEMGYGGTALMGWNRREDGILIQVEFVPELAFIKTEKDACFVLNGIRENGLLPKINGSFTYQEPDDDFINLTWKGMFRYSGGFDKTSGRERYRFRSSSRFEKFNTSASIKLITEISRFDKNKIGYEGDGEGILIADDIYFKVREAHDLMVEYLNNVAKEVIG